MHPELKMKKPLQTDHASGPRPTHRGSIPAFQKNRAHTLPDTDWKPPEKFRTVSLKTIAELLDTTRSSARRWLKDAGIRPVALGRGAKGAIRYRWKELETWLNSRDYVE